MKITIINGQNHNGTTCHIARLLAEKLHGEITEFFLPRDFGEFCTGCGTCFLQDEKLCPHYEKLRPITKSMDEADVIILASPVYVYHVTGAMKAFLDHYGYQWIVHRPKEAMFHKVGVCISTAAGSGTKSANKDMADSLFFWGVGKIYQYGVNVHSMTFQNVDQKVRREIYKRILEIAVDIRKTYRNVQPGVKTKGFFTLMRKLHKKGFSDIDDLYWRQNGWLADKRPWKETDDENHETSE